MSSLPREGTLEVNQHHSLPGRELAGKAREVANVAVSPWERPLVDRAPGTREDGGADSAAGATPTWLSCPPCLSALGKVSGPSETVPLFRPPLQAAGDLDLARLQGHTP